MSKALVSFANGPHKELLDIALPSFHEFADRHGYDVLIPDQPDCARPASWFKVAFLLAALQDYDEALWLDADMVIVDPRDDLHVPERAWQAMVEHHTGDGHVPNCGMWFVRKPMFPFLERAWGMDEFLNAGWWEQAAMHRLLGYSEDRPVRGGKPTELFKHTHWLDHGWNWHPWDRPTPDRVRVAHATMWSDRAGVMREWAKTAAQYEQAAA